MLDTRTKMRVANLEGELEALRAALDDPLILLALCRRVAHRRRDHLWRALCLLCSTAVALLFHLERTPSVFS